MFGVLLAGALVALQGGWWLTTDSVDLFPHLPIVLSGVASVLLVRHGLTARRWLFDERSRVLSRRVAPIVVVLLAAAVINIGTDRVEGAKKIAACFGLVVCAGYTWLFTRAVLRIAERERVSRRGNLGRVRP
jgi:hypothetical protein